MWRNIVTTDHARRQERGLYLYQEVYGPRYLGLHSALIPQRALRLSPALEPARTSPEGLLPPQIV